MILNNTSEFVVLTHSPMLGEASTIVFGPFHNFEIAFDFAENELAGYVTDIREIYSPAKLPNVKEFLV